MKFKITALFYILVLTVLFSLPAQENFEIKEGIHILEKERVYSDGEIQLIPDFSYTELIRERIINHNTAYLTEIVWVMPKLPEEYADPDTLIKLFIDVESLEGIEYWSGGRGRMHPYIKKSYRVESNKSRNALLPAEWSSGTETVNFVQLQRDTAFGTNWYDVTLRHGPDSIVMETVNLNDLKAYTKKTQDAGGVLLQMAVIPQVETTLMYCAVAFKEFPPIGWGKSAVSGSFNHRISAIQTWFATAVFGSEEP